MPRSTFVLAVWVIKRRFLARSSGATVASGARQHDAARVHGTRVLIVGGGLTALLWIFVLPKLGGWPE